MVLSPAVGMGSFWGRVAAAVAAGAFTSAASAQYCGASDGTCNSTLGEERIIQVMIGSINNTLGPGTGNCYKDYTTLSTTVAHAVGYTLTVRVANSQVGDIGAVWIDWNQNTTFDAGEKLTLTPVGTLTGNPATMDWTVSVLPPTSSLLGPTRMRIRVQYNDVTQSPCGNANYGGTQDYTLNVVASGACCDSSTCTITLVNACAATFAGPDTTCTASVCTGSCCNLTNGACTTTTGSACSGTYGGLNTTCTPNPCAGACCNAATGACTTSATTGCATGTTFQNIGTACTPTNPCPQPPPPSNDECAAAIDVFVATPITGSNVNATPSAALTQLGAPDCAQTTFATGVHKDVFYKLTAPATAAYTIDTCGSSFDTILSLNTACPIDQSSLIACNDDSSSSVGGACSSSGLHSRITSITLTSGQIYYIGVAGYNGASGAFSLLVSYINTVGSCCVGTACTLTDSANCTGTYTDGGSCSPSPCGGPAGVCCRGSTCTTSITSAAACTASLAGALAGATFPTAAACNTGGSTTTPCCYPDYNKVNGVGVPDIFDFLNDWFAGKLFAAVGGDGNSGTLAVQNIFDFLNAWFAGGCAP